MNLVGIPSLPMDILLRLAAKNDWTTRESIENALEAYKNITGVDLTSNRFALIEVELSEFVDRNRYQPLYTSVAEVGQYQIDGGKDQSVADDRMLWFQDMINVADKLFPSLGVVDKNGYFMLIDGVQRASARHIAGLKTVWVYATTLD